MHVEVMSTAVSNWQKKLKDRYPFFRTTWSPISVLRIAFTSSSQAVTCASVGVAGGAGGAPIAPCALVPTCSDGAGEGGGVAKALADVIDAPRSIVERSHALHWAQSTLSKCNCSVNFHQPGTERPFRTYRRRKLMDITSANPNNSHQITCISDYKVRVRSFVIVVIQLLLAPTCAGACSLRHLAH